MLGFNQRIFRTQLYTHVCYALYGQNTGWEPSAC